MAGVQALLTKHLEDTPEGEIFLYYKIPIITINLREFLRVLGEVRKKRVNVAIKLVQIQFKNWLEYHNYKWLHD